MSKVIIHKSREVFLKEQDIIEYVSVAYLKFIIKFLRIFLNCFHLHSMQLFSADAKILKKKIQQFFAPQNIENPPSKVAHNLTRPPVFSPASF